DGGVLGELTDARELPAVQAEPPDIVEGDGDGALDRGGGREPRADRDIRVDVEVDARDGGEVDGRPGGGCLAERPGHPERVGGPVVQAGGEHGEVELDEL